MGKAVTFPAQRQPSLTFTPNLTALATWLSRWSYAASAEALGGRDVRLDLLRGFAVFAMVVDHVGGESSWLYAITGGNHFFVSAAEAFVLLSGLTFGIVYRGVLKRGIGAAIRKALARAARLYLLTVGLALATATLALAVHLPWAPAATADNAIAWALDVLTVHRAYYLTDVLLLYTLLMLTAAPALVLLATGRTWAVLTASWALWAVFQFSPQTTQIPWFIEDNSAFPFAAWQVTFFSATAIGYHRAVITRWLRRVPIALTLLASGALSAGLVALAIAAPDLPQAAWLADVFYKYEVRPGRLLALAVFGTFAFSLTTVAWAPLRRGVGWLLLPLGRSALTAYALHLFVVALLTMYVAAVRATAGGSEAENTLIQLVGVLSIWAAVVAKRRLPDVRQALVAALSWGRALGHRPRRRHTALVLATLAAVALSACAQTSAGGVTLSAPVVEAAEFDAKATTLSTMQGRVERLTFTSAILGRDMPYTVYLPAGYDGAATRYPVLYMLHGMGGKNDEWERLGLLNSADQLMASGQIRPFIVVLPQGDQGYWVDWANNGPQYGNYMALEVVPEIDTRFRTIAARDARAIGGLSMGGHGALQLALNYPQIFGIAGAHSPTLRAFEDRIAYFGDAEYFAAHNPADLLQGGQANARDLELWIDVGIADEWRPAAAALHALLARLDIPHIWQETPGGHTDAYWIANIPEYLRFYGRALA